VVAFLAIPGCGIGEGGTDDLAAQQARDFEKLSASYHQIQGVYQGTLATGDPSYPRAPGTLSVYVVETDAGSNPDGSHRTPPVLKARFRLDKAASETDNTILTGDYKKETGRLVLTSEAAGAPGGGIPSSGSATPGSSLSLSGLVSGQALTGVEIMHNGGTWGVFEGKRVAGEVISPIGGDETADRNRLYAIFGVAEGRYAGVIRGDQPQGVSLKLFVNQGSDLARPTVYLAGRMDFAGGVPGVAIIYLVATQFDALTGQIFLQQNPDPGGHFSLRGWIRNGHIEAEVRSRDGKLGTLVGQRQN
jgi:hypothetical protein